MPHGIRALFAVIGLAIAALPAFAHHSLYAVFDEELMVTLKGVVSKVEWMDTITMLGTTDPAPMWLW